MSGYVPRPCSSNTQQPPWPALKGKIVFLVNDAAFFVSHRLPLARAARAAGMEVHVATPEGDAVDKIVAEGFAFHPVSMTRSGMNPFRELRALVGVTRLLRALQPDILHSVAIKPVLYGGLAARLLKTRAVVSAIPGLGSVFTRRGPWARTVQRGVMWIYARALRHRSARVIFQNPEDQQQFTQAAIVRPECSALIRGSGVDLDRFRALPLLSGRPVVMLASRMLWAKGIAEFVEAAKMLKARGSDARFVLVGAPDDGNPWSVPTEKLRDWHTKGTVEWWGRREDMPDVISQAYAFCLPSYYGEGVPKALIEAAACGRPLIATNVPGCREVVRQNENGFLVPVRDETRLADAIETLLADRSLAEAMGRRSREIAENEFAVERVVHQTLKLYEELLKFSRPSVPPAV